MSTPYNQGTAPLRHVARITIELTAPLSIGTGRAGDFEDALFVTDASGLPAIPATSLAGVLRRAHTLDNPSLPTIKTGSVFGWVQGDDGERSRLSISWGHLHTQHNRPVPALLAPAEITGDPVLEDAARPIVRDHVRINHAGTADQHGKFDRSSVSAGHRFTFELELLEHPEPSQSERLPNLLALLASGTVRLGGHTRAGLGTFVVKTIQHRLFDLRDATDRAAYSAMPVCLSEPAPQLAKMPVQAPTGGQIETITLTPEAPWLIGGGAPETYDATDPINHEKPPNMLPYRERRVRWKGDQGAPQPPRWIVPGSSIKGALRHRTAFHLRVALGQRGDAETWADDITVVPDPLAPNLDPFAPDQVPGLDTLFGSVHNTQLERGQRADTHGQAGSLFISDGTVLGSPRLSVRSHVSLDRFTGGPMPGLLFTDAPLEGGQIRFTVQRPARTDDNALALAAFERALDDLCEGHLQLGAGHGKGYGWFTGTKETPR